MAYLGWLTLLYLLAITPLRVAMVLSAGPGLPTGAAAVLAWGVGVRLDLFVERDAQGNLTLRVCRRGGKKGGKGDVPTAVQGVAQTLRFLRTANRTRAFLARTVHARGVALEARLGLSNAARTALVSAAAGTLASAACARFRWLRVRVTPDFSGARIEARARCILDMRLGNLLLGAAMAASAWICMRLRQRREKPIPVKG